MTVTLLKAQNLRKLFGQFSAVADFSFSIDRGEIVSLLGPNGAGKSTIISMLYGACLPTGGSVFYQDIPIKTNNLRWFLSKIGVVTQENNLDPDLSVSQNLEVFAGYHGKYGLSVRKTIQKLLELVNLTDKAEANVEEISGGMKRRLILARALIGEPEVVFLDEPTTGLDPDARQQFWKLILELKSQGVSILLTTHYMDETERLSDRLILLQRGEVVATGKPHELIKEKVGMEIFEIYGVGEAVIETFALQAGLWQRPFAGGFLLSVVGQADQIERDLKALHPHKLIRRSANLEDVFLKLTGDRL
ncbi:MAG: ATP-binding cassette domain-containing protein [Candidatus Caenarcaniphilales bacterium]|nr:ATP-binding cassette domain-containing protein [Candidatus Caenarcaniphilales bacterium]